MDVIEPSILIGLGLVAGLLGGLLGIGGSIVMIPVLTVLLEKSQHLAQAAAMIVNFFVAAPSVWRHNIARAVRWDAMIRTGPAGIVMIVVGVEVSDHFTGEAEGTLRFVFGAFLLYVVASTIVQLRNAKQRRENPPAERVHWAPCSLVGAITGFMAGLLGIGGGVLIVPLLHHVCRMRLRQSIATSSALMCVTAVIGASRKNFTLSEHLENGVALDPVDSLYLAACLAPTAIIGGLIGARLTHVLPLRWVRIILIVLLLAAALRMMNLWPV